MSNPDEKRRSLQRELYEDAFSDDDTSFNGWNIAGYAVMIVGFLFFMLSIMFSFGIAMFLTNNMVFIIAGPAFIIAGAIFCVIGHLNEIQDQLTVKLNRDLYFERYGAVPPED